MRARGTTIFGDGGPPTVSIERIKPSKVEKFNWLIGFDDLTSSEYGDLIDDCVSMCRSGMGINSVVRHGPAEIRITSASSFKRSQAAKLGRELQEYLAQQISEVDGPDR